VNALTDSGMSELTSEICHVVAPEKLGSMQQVLSGDLKRSALAGRSRRHRDTVNRIAARLALHTVDQKAGDQDLIAVAAEGVCRYGVLTFEASDLAAALHQEMGRTPGEPDPGRQAAAAGGDQSPGGPDRHPGDHRRRTCHGTGRVRVNRTPPGPRGDPGCPGATRATSAAARQASRPGDPPLAPRPAGACHKSRTR
jgi:hypothetical protein